jgi:hypothetical protein
LSGFGIPTGAIAGSLPNTCSVSGNPSAVSSPEIPEVTGTLTELRRNTRATVFLPAISGTVLSWFCTTCTNSM